MPVYDLERMVTNDAIRKGTIILSHDRFDWTKPLSYVTGAIRKLTNSHWNHAMMYIGGGKIIEADWRGVVRNDLVDNYKGEELSFWEHKKIDNINRNQLVYDAASHEGIPYDYFQLLDLAKMFITGSRWKDQVKAGKTNKFICSEVASKPYYDQGFPVIKKYTYDKIAPCDFSRSINFRRKDFEGYVL